MRELDRINRSMDHRARFLFQEDFPFSAPPMRENLTRRRERERAKTDTSGNTWNTWTVTLPSSTSVTSATAATTNW